MLKHNQKKFDETYNQESDKLSKHLNTNQIEQRIHNQGSPADSTHVSRIS